MIESNVLLLFLLGLVSSKRRLVLPPNSAASPKLRQMDLAWPMCRYPLGSGGKRVCTRPLYLLVFRSSRMMSRTKLDGRGDGSAVSGVGAVVTSRSGVGIDSLGRAAGGEGAPDTQSGRILYFTRSGEGRRASRNDPCIASGQAILLNPGGNSSPPPPLMHDLLKNQYVSLEFNTKILIPLDL